MMEHLLTIIVFSPLAGALLCLLLPAGSKNAIRALAFAASLVPLFFSLLLLRVMRDIDLPILEG